MRPEHLALWRTGDRPPPLSLVCQKYKLVSEERCRLLHPVPPSSLLPACSPLSVPRPLILFLIRWSGVDRDSLVQARATLVLFFGFSISAKNLCQPTCWHVFKRGGCASSRGKRRGAGPGERKGGGGGKGLGSQVTGMQCRISQYPGRVKGEKRTPRAAAARRRVYTHTRATRTPGLPAVSWIKTIRDGRERTGTEGGRTYVFAYNKREVMSR